MVYDHTYALYCHVIYLYFFKFRNLISLSLPKMTLNCRLIDTFSDDKIMWQKIETQHRFRELFQMKYFIFPYSTVKMELFKKFEYFKSYCECLKLKLLSIHK